MLITLKTTVEHREGGGGGGGGHCDIELLRKVPLMLKIAEMVGEHCHGISWGKCAMH